MWQKVIHNRLALSKYDELGGNKTKSSQEMWSVSNVMICLLADEQFEQAEEHTGLTHEEKEENGEEGKDEDREN